MPARATRRSRPREDEDDVSSRSCPYAIMSTFATNSEGASGSSAGASSSDMNASCEPVTVIDASCLLFFLAFPRRLPFAACASAFERGGALGIGAAPGAGMSIIGVGIGAEALVAGGGIGMLRGSGVCGGGTGADCGIGAGCGSGGATVMEGGFAYPRSKSAYKASTPCGGSRQPRLGASGCRRPIRNEGRSGSSVHRCIEAVERDR